MLLINFFTLDHFIYTYLQFYIKTQPKILLEVQKQRNSQYKSKGKQNNQHIVKKKVYLDSRQIQLPIYNRINQLDINMYKRLFHNNSKKTFTKMFSNLFNLNPKRSEKSTNSSNNKQWNSHNDNTHNFTNNSKLMKSLAIGAFAIINTTLHKYFTAQQQSSQSQTKTLRDQIKQAYQAQRQMKKIIEIQVCKSQEIKQQQVLPIKVKNKSDGQDFTILIIRYNGKLYAVGGQCTHRDNFLQQKQVYRTMQNAITFNDKLMCPHHGCAYDIKSGSVQYGPALHNLPIFAVNQRDGIVKLNYPEKIPKRVNPKTVPRDYSDQRKVLILGQDHNSAIGCINGLRQYGFDGEVAVVMQNTDYPYRKDQLHKSIKNFHLLQKHKNDKKDKNDKQDKKKSSIPIPGLDKQLQTLLQQKIYSKLYFHPQKWYQQHGIEFVYNSEPYRIIHKRFYPYITFFDGTKKQYDGLVIAVDVLPKPYKLEQINCTQTGQSLMADNVFMPYRSKTQHKKLMKFLNTNEVKSMIVFGLDQFTLEFLQQLRIQFPQIKVKVVDIERENKLLETYGEELTMKILKQYTQRDMQFYLKVNTMIKTKNKIMQSSDILVDNVERVSQTKNGNIMATRKEGFNYQKQLKDSIELKLVDEVNEKQSKVIKADCMVIFPSKYQGNTFNIKKKGKYIDLDFTQENRIVTEPNQKTDTSKVLSVGTVAESEFFFSKSRLNTFNPNVLYEQGLVAAFNLLALGIPFAYIPVEVTQHFGKKMFHAGIQTYFNQMVVLGSIQNWDFIAIYAKNQKIYSVVASQSRQREFQILRESFRLQCQPEFTAIVNNDWTIPNIHKLIKKINKSYCYRDEIHKIEEDPIKGNIMWVERRQGAGFANDKPQQNDTGLEIDERGYVRQV